MKRFLHYFIVTLFLLLHAIPAHAVLKGYSLNETVIMLRSELEVFTRQVNTMHSDFMRARDDYKAELQEFRREMASAKLSLFSQQEQYVFGNAYASEVAKRLCDDFYGRNLPIDLWKTTYERTLSRCQQLHKTLSEIDPALLDDGARHSREEGLAYIDQVLASINTWHDQILDDLDKYRALAAEVEALQRDIDSNYNYILNSMLLTPDKQPTHKVFSENFASNWSSFKNTVVGIFGASHYYGWEFQDKWNAEALFIILAGIIAFFVGVLFAILALYCGWIKRWKLMENHPAIFSIFCGWNAVTITYFVIKVAVTSNPFFGSALNLVIELCLMYVMLNFSVLLRMKSDQLIPTILAYMPTVALSAIIFLFRLLLVDINVVRIAYPVTLLALIVAQIFVILRLHRKLLPLDRYVSILAVLLFSLCFMMNFWGYYYLSVYIALSWAIFIIGHLVLSCFYNYLYRVERRRLAKDEEGYRHSWMPFTFKWLFKPMSLILVLLVCTLECVHVFNINEWFNGVFDYKFVNFPDIVCISARRVFFIVISAILTNYFVLLVNHILRIRYHERADVGAINLSRNIFAIVVWCVFVLLSLAYIEVNYIGILATLGGFAIGLGVALRDTFDCLLCGIILMMGRIKIGDYVEIGNSYRGKVIDIQYRTTLIETDDGAVISVFNTQFFDKDFRNMSYTGDYQRLHIAFRVQKEIDTVKVREMLAQALTEKVPEIAKHPAPVILFGSSDNYHINMIAQVWVSVYDYDEGISNVKEALFNTLFEHGLRDMSVESRVIFTKDIMDVKEADIYTPKGIKRIED